MPQSEVGKRLLALEDELVGKYSLTKRGRIELRALLEKRDVLLLAAARGHHLAEAYRVVATAVEKGAFPDEIREALRAQIESPLPVRRGRSYVMDTTSAAEGADAQ